MKSLLNSQSGNSTIFGFLFILTVFGVTFLWQQSTDRQQEQLDNADGNLYVSPAGEFYVAMPTEWTVTDGSYEDEGIISIQLSGPNNTAVSEGFLKQEGVVSTSIEDAVANGRLNELIGTPVGTEFALLQIDAFATSHFEPSASREEWKELLTTGTTTADGIAYADFTDYSTDSASGYKYNLRVFEGDQEIEFIGYYLLGVGAEVEVLFFPVSSSYADAAEKIVDSIVISDTVPLVEN